MLKTMNKKLTPISSLKTEELIKLEADLANYTGDDMVVSSDEMRALYANKRALPFFATGISGLDKAMGCIQAGELIALGGPTKHGKTLLSQTITRNMAEAGVACLWFTFEVPAAQFLEQTTGAKVFYLPKKLETGNLEWLRQRIFEAKTKYDAKVVFVDNLHHLIDFTEVRNVSLDIGSAIRELKRMAIELNVAILILCHSRKPENSKDGAPQEVSEWDLRDSSFIPQECDSTIMIQRKAKVMRDQNGNAIGYLRPITFGDEAIVKVCLHRRTGAMGRIIHVVKVGQFLEEDPR